MTLKKYKYDMNIRIIGSDAFDCKNLFVFSGVFFLHNIRYPLHKPKQINPVLAIDLYLSISFFFYHIVFKILYKF